MIRCNAFEALESRLFQSATPAGEVHTTVKTDVVAVTVPAAPSGLAAVAGGHSVKLQWTDNSDNETGFDVQRYANKVLVDLGRVAANVTTFTDASAPVGLDYYVVRSFNTAGHGEGSYTSVTVKPDTTIISVIAPNKLSIYAASTSQLNMGWAGDAGATAGYTIQRSADGLTGWTTVGTTPAGTRFFSDHGLSAKTRYFYRVVANGGSATATSAVFYGFTKATDNGDKKPAAPTSIHK